MAVTAAFPGECRANRSIEKALFKTAPLNATFFGGESTSSPFYDVSIPKTKNVAMVIISGDSKASPETLFTAFLPRQWRILCITRIRRRFKLRLEGERSSTRTLTFGWARRRPGSPIGTIRVAFAAEAALINVLDFTWTLKPLIDRSPRNRRVAGRCPPNRRIR